MLASLAVVAPALVAPASNPGGHTSSTGFILIGVLMLLAGSFNALKPALSWRMGQIGKRWQFRNPDAVQPSSAALAFTRVGGVVTICIGIGLLIYGIA